MKTALALIGTMFTTRLFTAPDTATVVQPISFLPQVCDC